MRASKLGPLQTKWVEALESGKFKQGTGFLCQRKVVDGEEEFCCLGVACVS